MGRHPGSAQQVDRLAVLLFGRFVLTARTELTDRMLVFSERHLWRVLTVCARHYNGHRPHRGRTRTDLPAAWDERTMVDTFLDYARATVHAKCAGSSEADTRRAPLVSSSLMTVSGPVSHLRWVEYWWSQVMLLGEEDHGPWTDEDPDREMRLAVQVPIAELLYDYQLQCAPDRELAG